MAKRELSTTLRNLKFMQRAAPKEEPKPAKKEEEEAQEPHRSSFGASESAPKKRCVVIMEGNPRPGVLKGRMSFQSFNPSIDKLHEEAANVHQTQAANASYQNGGSDSRGNGDSKMRSEEDYSNVADISSDPDIDLKRKQTEMEMEKPSPPNKLLKVASEESNGQSSSSSSHNSSEGPNKQRKREKLDWNVLLRPPRPQI